MVDTIAAVATPPGTGAIAIVRISGPETREILSRVIPGRGPTLPLRPRRMVLDWLVDSSCNRVDQVLAVFFPAGSSYTGEEQAEIHCHGGPVVTSEVLRAVIEAGAREAAPGEFTRRAYLNGVISLDRAEAVAQVIMATDPQEVRAAARLLAGELGNSLDELAERCADLVAELEAAIDFPDDVDLPADVLAGIEELASKVGLLRKDLRLGGVVSPTLVLCGPPNAGKSTLANRLAGRELAIVTARAGTTRDAVSADIILGDHRVRLVDTAGLVADDPADDEIAELATRATLREAGNATVLVWMCEVGKECAPPDEVEPQLLVVNKVDLLDEQQRLNVEAAGDGRIYISAAQGIGMDRLRQSLTGLLDSRLGPATGLPVSSRQKAHLHRAGELLASARLRVEEGLLELACEDLRQARQEMESVGGRTQDTELLDRIFMRFCVGK